MPLIVLCGRPSSGKTTRAMELKTYFEGISKMPVVVLNEESLGLDRNSSYADNVKEKEFRGFFRSHVEKNLNQQTIVIVDTLNYIKGVRYEYYCLARTAKTTYAVVYCETPIDAASAWNSSRDPKQAYAQPLFEDLWKRMEEPNSRSKRV